MSKYLIDSDVLTDYLRGDSRAGKFLEKYIVNSIFYLSSITIAELYAGIREGRERRTFEEFLNAFQTIPIDPEIARMGGLFRRDYFKSHGVGLADALIAATAVKCEAKLVTLNKKHFPMLKSIVVPYTK